MDSIFKFFLLFYGLVLAIVLTVGLFIIIMFEIVVTLFDAIIFGPFRLVKMLAYDYCKLVNHIFRDLDYQNYWGYDDEVS